MLCNLDIPVTSVQNAASWGFFDCKNNCWNNDILNENDFPVNILPKIAKSGAIAGTLADNWHTIPKETPIGNIKKRGFFCRFVKFIVLP